MLVDQHAKKQLKDKKVTILGAGALGTVSSMHLARLQVGYIRIIDRDFVEYTNLHRQMLFDENDAKQHQPKAIAAARKLQKINNTTMIDPVIEDIHPENAETYLSDTDIILDGTDNFQTRFLINDVSLKHNIPWIYGGAVSSRGMMAVFQPNITPCFRCLFPTPPTVSGDTCDTAGVISSITSLIASFQANETIKLLTRSKQNISTKFEHFDLWHNDYLKMDLLESKNPNCPACVHEQYEFLEGTSLYHDEITTLCGRDTVQITPKTDKKLDFESLIKKFSTIGKIEVNPFLLRVSIEDTTLVVFKNGRVLIQGTDNIPKAKSIYSRYLGF